MAATTTRSSKGREDQDTTSECVMESSTLERGVLSTIGTQSTHKHMHMQDHTHTHKRVGAVATTVTITKHNVTQTRESERAFVLVHYCITEGTPTCMRGEARHAHIHLFTPVLHISLTSITQCRHCGMCKVNEPMTSFPSLHRANI